ncbi:MAG: leucyl aminopeptidase [Candidatus Paracaedibacteraceae bacterium]|nr:leucyl aminopeptidase [Candidatus Paracaedibacteraceae bacterium]
MHIKFSAPTMPNSGVLVAVVSSNKLDSFLSDLDVKLNGQITGLISSKTLDIDKGGSVSILCPVGLSVSKIHLVAIGKIDSHLDYEILGGKVYSALGKEQSDACAVYVPSLPSGDLAGIVASGIFLKSWDFPKYFTKKEATDFCQVKTVTVISEQAADAEKKFRELEQVAEGVFLARHVCSEPPNVIYPETLAAEAKKLESLGLNVEILGEAELEKLGCHSLLGVGQGSSKESKLVVIQWNGGKTGEAPVAFVGKGVTFDTGGISLKPAQDMDDMKWDMGGAAAVLGVMRALAGRKAAVNAIGVMGLVENMPDGNAQRPGDVVKSMSGQTIEVLNTDAEGRLVLADALWYTQDRFKPTYMINLATLTGAIIISLGDEYAGLFSNNDELASSLNDAGLKVGEKLWRLPLAKAYDKQIDSVIADVKNIGNGRSAGSITAAQFLQRFVNQTKWAHLDIAGTAWNKKAGDLYQAGSTAFGVRLLNMWVKKHIEKR